MFYFHIAQSHHTNGINRYDIMRQLWYQICNSVTVQKYKCFRNNRKIVLPDILISHDLNWLVLYVTILHSAESSN